MSDEPTNGAEEEPKKVSRRDLLRAGAAGAVGLAAAGGAMGFQRAGDAEGGDRERIRGSMDGHDHLHSMGSTGDVDTSAFDPMAYLTDFDGGRVSTLPDGQTLREYEFVAREVEVGGPSAARRGTGSGSTSPTPDPTPTPSTSTGSTQRGWTVSSRS